jgi:DNA invertase Pin-like site-specific DNA recombinase
MNETLDCSQKITPDHLSRSAYVYVRQSTLRQVREHEQGRERQYELADRTKQLGFAKTVVIDDDQGKSGSGFIERPGFLELLAAVCRGDVGAVFALEASRLARNNLDWYHLIELCAMTRTLIVDADGTYDPRLLNDRLLLGLKGTMSEFELNLFRQRGREALERKIGQGHLLWEVPVGFVRNDEDRVEKFPDRRVQTAVAGVFAKFAELGSARQTLLWYRDQQIALPEVVPATSGREVAWRLPSESGIRQILKNPCYAGALAYGRTEAKTAPHEDVIHGRRTRKSNSRQRKPREQWKVLILGNHEGYIDWETYLKNQVTLEANLAMRDGEGKGAAKGGPALLAGLLRCGHCGRKLFVAYGGRGRTSHYACHGGRVNRGNASCQSLGGWRVEAAVCEAVLEAVQPGGVEAALQAADQAGRQLGEKEQALELALEQARYQTARARRQYDSVDPDNRLVASELERRWNVALQQEVDLSEQLAALRQQTPPPLTAAEQTRLLELGSDLRKLWDHPSASTELKKRVLRTGIEEIVIADNADRSQHVLQVHWKGGVHTELKVVRATIGKKPNDTDVTALQLIEELSKVCTDQAIAATLNRLGFLTGAGKTWRVHSVHNARNYHRLPNHRNSDAWLTVEDAATASGVSHTVIRRLIREKILPAQQVVETTPWIIDRTDLSLPAVQEEIEAVKQGRQLRRRDPNQHELPLK